MKAMPKPELQDEEIFPIQIKCLHLIGFHRSKLIKFPKFFRLLGVFSSFCIIFSVVVEGSFILKNYDDVLASTEAFAPFCTVSITLLKYFTFLLSREDFYKLMDQIKELSLDLDKNDSIFVAKVNKINKRVSLVFATATWITGFGYLIVPLAADIISYTLGNNPNREMPYKSVYPYDVKSSPGYEISYIMLFFATYYVLFAFVSIRFKTVSYSYAFISVSQIAIDCLFIGVSLNICGHFDILRNSYDGDSKKFIKQHQKLLKLSETFNKLFKPIVFTQFLVTSMLLCVLGFQLVVFDSFVKKFKASTFGVSMIIQLLFYAYGGQMIMDKSSSVGDRLYTTKKDLVIIIIRSQKPSVITAGFYQATAGTFTTIVNSAASLIALLKSFI